VTIFKSLNTHVSKSATLTTPKSLIWSALDRSWSDNLNRANTWTKQERQTTSYKDDKQNKVALRWQNHERRNEIYVKIAYFNKREIEKRVRGVILGQKLTLNHPSLVDEGEETRVLVTAHNKEKGKSPIYLILNIVFGFSRCFLFVISFRI